MTKLYFELTKFDDADQVVYSDSYLINLDEHGLLFRLVIIPLSKIFMKWRDSN